MVPTRYIDIATERSYDNIQKEVRDIKKQEVVMGKTMEGIGVTMVIETERLVINIASDDEMRVLVETETDPEMKARYNELQQEVASMRKDIARLEPVIRAVGEKLGKGEKLSLDQMKQAKLLSTQLATSKEKLKNDLVELAKLEVSFDQTTDASVQVTGQAYPGTKLVISECRMTLKTPYHYCRFVREGADVIMKAL